MNVTGMVCMFVSQLVYRFPPRVECLPEFLSSVNFKMFSCSNKYKFSQFISMCRFLQMGLMFWNPLWQGSLSLFKNTVAQYNNKAIVFFSDVYVFH